MGHIISQDVAPEFSLVFNRSPVNMAGNFCSEFFHFFNAAADSCAVTPCTLDYNLKLPSFKESWLLMRIFQVLVDQTGISKRFFPLFVPAGSILLHLIALYFYFDQYGTCNADTNECGTWQSETTLAQINYCWQDLKR